MSHKCDCGGNPGHSTPDQCADNRTSTRIYMGSATRQGLAEADARGEALRKRHETHLAPAYGCPLCPIDSSFRRADSGSEWAIPDATTATIEEVKREADGTYRVTFLADSGYWIGVYLADGRLAETVWEPAESIPTIDPAELRRLANS